MDAEQATDTLARVAGTLATMTAAAYLRKQGVTLADSDVPTMTAHVKRYINERCGEAIHDAREAIDLGMTEWAMQSFRADMALAGIAAAKRFISEREGGAQ